MQGLITRLVINGVEVKDCGEITNYTAPGGGLDYWTFEYGDSRLIDATGNIMIVVEAIIEEGGGNA